MFHHQKEIFQKIYKDEFHALFMDTGTGKSKVSIDNFSYAHLFLGVTKVLIVAPSGVCKGWIEEHLVKDCPCEYKAFRYISGNKNKFEYNIDKLNILLISVDSVATKIGYAVCEEFMAIGKVFMLIDESTKIKNNEAKRTKAIIKIGKKAAYRRILTGTPVANRVLDLYSQCNFLKEGLLGYDSFKKFSERYGLFATCSRLFGGRKVWYQRYMGGKNLGELKNKLSAFSTKITKEECLDLPLATFETHYIDLCIEQRRAIKTLKEEGFVFTPKCEVYASENIQRKQKEQQISQGFIYNENKVAIPLIPFENSPKFLRLLEIIDSIEDNKKVIIWAKYRYEVDELHKHLENSVTYFGDMNTKKKDASLDLFRTTARFLIGTAATGGFGLNLQYCSDMVYFSNDWSYENRKQSADRIYRMGQEKRVTYHDFISAPIDKTILEALEKKKNVEDYILQR